MHLNDTIKCSSSAKLPTSFGSFVVQTFEIEEVTHFVLIKGNVTESEGVLVRIHSECLTGDVFGSKRCDCRHQLETSLSIIENNENGIVIYLRGHEGRGIGLEKKIFAYTLQDGGCDTVEANTKLGLPIDNRNYRAAVKILLYLKVSSIHLLTNNLNKMHSLREGGINVLDRIPIHPSVCQENRNYLTTKLTKMGHLFDIKEGVACGLKS